jgi:4-amino-4-deoxy-L-arabinose transferase-like glycosyltransferase
MRLPVSRVLLAVLALAALAVGIDNMERPLANPDEGRYSEISREMAASGDWVTPRLNGIKYFEKPPLQYWASALAFRLFGDNEYSARLYIGLAGLATVLLCGFIGRRLWGADAGLASMLALACSPYFLALGGIVTLDMGLTLWTTATLFAFLAAEGARDDPRAQLRWMLAAWAAMALATLSKGLVGIVFAGAAIAGAIALGRDLSALRRLRLIPGLAVFLAIAAPWFLAVSMANEEFAQFFFFHEHLTRFLTREHRRVEPGWYFVPIVACGFLPWMFALPAAIAAAWKEEAGRAFQPLRLALAWSAFVVAFFSASGSKLPAYVLPAFPPLALVLGRYLATAPERRLALWSGLAVPVGVALLVAAWRVPESAKDDWTRALYTAAMPWAVAAAVALLAGSICTTFLLLRGRRWSALVVATLATFVLIACGEDAYEELSPRQSGMIVAEKMKPLIGPATRLYSVGHYEQTVPFYLKRTLTLFDYEDEFETGQKAEARFGKRELHEFGPDWLRPGDALAIMQPRVYDVLKAQGLPMQVLHADLKRVLVRKPGESLLGLPALRPAHPRRGDDRGRGRHAARPLDRERAAGAGLRARARRLRGRASRAHAHLGHRRDAGRPRAGRRGPRRRGDHAGAKLLRHRERDRARRRHHRLHRRGPRHAQHGPGRGRGRGDAGHARAAAHALQRAPRSGAAGRARAAPRPARGRGCGARHRLARGRKDRGKRGRPGVVQLPSQQEHDHHRGRRAGGERRGGGQARRGAALPRHPPQCRRHARRGPAGVEVQPVGRLRAPGHRAASSPR